MESIIVIMDDCFPVCYTESPEDAYNYILDVIKARDRRGYDISEDIDELNASYAEFCDEQRIDFGVEIMELSAIKIEHTIKRDC